LAQAQELEIKIFATSSITNKTLTAKFSSIDKIIDTKNFEQELTQVSLSLRDIIVEEQGELGAVGRAVEGAAIAAAAMSGPMLIAGADPTLIWALVNLMQMLFYLLFLNVDYPDNLRSFL